jgi:GH25 family lysozyme M1 (1,4-beta-N-acetylmuramidase)
MRSVPHRTRGPRRMLALAGTVLLGVVPALTACTAPPPPPTPPGSQARGIDVSNYQHPGNAPIDWGAVRGSGIEFAFIKATEGPVGCGGGYYTNNWARRDLAESAAAGLYRGAYHFARPGDINSAVNQARYFVNAVGPMNGPRDLPPVLDIESSCGLGPADLAAFARAWVDEVRALTGRTPIVYTYYYFWQDQLQNDASLANLPLWIATYGARPLVPAPWHGNWTFWQHSSTGAVPGIAGNVDLNLFAWGSDALGRFVVEGASNPKGALDVAAGGPAAVTVAGWALDPDDPAPIPVHVYVDGQHGTPVTAAENRSDVGAVYPGAGPLHGFTVTVPGIPPGHHDVCAYGINTGPGGNVLLRCAPVDVAAVEPFGSVDSVVGGAHRVDVTGWALDPDTAAPATVHVWVDGAPRLAGDANLPRPDVAAAVPGAGPNRGFQLAVTGLAPGAHNVCVFALNIAGPGSNQLLVCRTATAT